MTFGSRLKELRIAAGLTQDELAIKLNTTKQSISRYENSSREPNIKTAKRIADALGVKLEALVVPSSEPHAPDLVNDDPELTEFLERVRDDPKYRMLFSVAKDATAEDIEKAIKIIQALKGE